MGGSTVNQQILAAIKLGVSPRPFMQCTIDVYVGRRQILAKTRNSPNIIARQNLLICSRLLLLYFFFSQQVEVVTGREESVQCNDTLHLM